MWWYAALRSRQILGIASSFQASLRASLQRHRKYVISTYLNDLPTLIQLLQGSAHTVAGVRARVLQLPDKTSYCCTHAVATYKCSAYALLLVRVRTSKSSSLRVGNKSFGSCSSTYACETYDLLWYNKSKYIAKCKINSCNASMTSARTWTTAP